MKIRAVALFCMLLMSIGLMAHQTHLSSTVLVDQGNNKWLLQVSSSMTAFEQEVITYYGDSSYSNPEEFQQLVVDYFRNKISVVFNEIDTAVLQSGMVKLGHETQVIFQLAETPENFQALQVHNSGFSDISRNQGFVVVLKDGFTKERFDLNKDNHHTVRLRPGDGKFELVDSNSNALFRPIIVIILVSIGLLALGYLLFRTKRTNP